MPTYTEKFRADSVKFCENHMIIVRHSGPPGIFHFTLKKAATSIARTWYGSSVTVCELFKVDDDAGDSVRAYWLPYNNNAKYQIQLKDEANYMFTPTMDGCTFAVGGRDADGAIAVSHLNYQKSVSANDPHHPTATVNIIDQGKIDTKLTALYEGGTVYVLRKGDYKSKEGHQVTTWGRRTNSGWSFYYQKRMVKGSKVKSVAEDQVLEGTTYHLKVKKSIDQFEFMGNHVGIRKQ